jgi:DNA-binding NarL/FixJ family response regulator
VSPTASTRSVPEPRQRVGGTGEVDGAAPATPAAAAARRLTPREREVLASLVAGRTNGEIARAMYISVKTASVHVSNILRKLDVPNREQAARLGYRLGVVPAADPERPEDDQP